ncbi:MAG: cation-translocating P-type ATPase, partial [Clostridia bacterium]|nr:cation-translocating P-type ATPase [Clostridia bacterium]
MKDKIDITEELKEYMVKPRSGAKRIKRSTLKTLYLKPLTRFAPDPVNGLTAAQVNERILQNKVNKKSKKYSKSVTGIITSNLFTFFNLLCVVCVIALMSVKAPIMNYTFAFVYVVNVAIGIFQEIRAKLTIEKLSLMNESPAKVLREGKFVDIPNSEIVMDEIIKFSYGNQISADCTVISGSAEVNESLLTGESTAVKKTAGSKLYAGSFVVSGEIIAVA